jgi:hypothetical protein
MALLAIWTTARDFGARVFSRGNAAVVSPGLLGRVARCYVAVALFAYILDLLRQTRGGLTNKSRM